MALFRFTNTPPPTELNLSFGNLLTSTLTNTNFFTTMKSAIVLVSFLLTISSYAQKKPLTYETAKEVTDDVFEYEITTSKSHPIEGRTNYNTLYCITTKGGMIAYELELVFHSWNGQMTSFLNVNSKMADGKTYESKCQQESKVVNISMDIVRLFDKKLVGGKEMLFSRNVTYEFEQGGVTDGYVTLDYIDVGGLGFRFK